MIAPRKLAAVLIALGAVLLAIAIVPTVYGSAMSRLAIARFRSQNPNRKTWSSARIRAFQGALAAQVAPPEAILRIPRLALEVPVLEGDSDLILNRAVGHIPSTPRPGSPGNIALAGHRDGFFRPLKDLRTGDLIVLELAARTDRYIVRTLRTVPPSDRAPLAPTAEPTLTLVTCFPFYFVGPAPERYIVQASLLQEAPHPH